MSTIRETSDSQVLDLLRRSGALSVADLARQMSVTPTAVRQRLSRLMAQRLVERDVRRSGRGRPGHEYRLTEKAQQGAGSNFGDLAMVLWEQVKSIADPAIRRGLLERIARGLSARYRSRVTGETTVERMRSLQELFADRRIPLEVRETGTAVQLTVIDCPYPELAEKDRSICAMERLLFSELAQTPLRLAECRMEGHACCQFQTSNP